MSNYSPKLPSTYSRIKGKIRRQVSEYMGYINIEDVTFASESNNENITANGLLVTIKFSINANGAVSSLTVNI